jgi:hypothetical protein
MLGRTEGIEGVEGSSDSDGPTVQKDPDAEKGS